MNVTSGIYRRSVIYDGLNCVSDMNSKRYKQAGTLSQSEVGWEYQLHYGNYLLYVGCSLIAVFLLKFSWYYLVDASYDSDLSTSDFLKNQAIISSSNNKKSVVDDKHLSYDSFQSMGSSKQLTGKHIDYSNTTNYNPSIIPKFTALLRTLSYKKLPNQLTKIGVPNLNFGIYFILLLCTIFTIAYVFGPRPYYRGCAGFGSPPIAIRAGLMAMTSLFYIFILSGKTNIVSLITGIGYEKLYIYHKYVSFACLTLALIHTVPFIYQADREGGYHNWRVNYHENYVLYTSGFVALACLAWLCLASLPIFRRLSHEIFFHFHWMVACVFFGTLVWHMANSMNTWSYMWGLLVIWLVQLIYRAGVKTALKPNQWFLKTRMSKISKLSHDSYQIEILNSGLHWEAGQHIFIRLTGLRILDSHPFTIASIPSNTSDTIKLIIRSKNGLTKSIANKLSSMSSNDPEIGVIPCINQSVYIDGPYGVISRDVYKFDNAVLISNGSGVTFTLPFLQKYAIQINNSIAIANKSNSSKATLLQPIIKRVRFIWIVKDIETFDWVKYELEKCYKLGKGLIEIDVYITRQSSPSFDDQKFEDFSNIKQFAFCNVYYTRPDMKLLIKESLKTDLLRRNIFISSGNASLSSDVSNGVASIQKCVWGNKGSCVEDIYLHTECFGY